ncbi:hypothetical protein CAEBREN_22972 [Caenorhabditis brenneri]|uniref:Serpentine Receptor, class T n=1 Tax=Caenorhabditis brenneri TaxID=135651 RepID=G0PJB7_CAEBE|nr:hypothetical protein CAEBREN_22972 [Caenorhabditis brenneri]
MDLLTSDLDQSFNFVIRNGFKLHPHFYNCTGVDGFELGTRRQYIGSYFLAVGCILLTIYIPCLIVISKSDLMKSSCYKIMVFLGILDICCILTNSVATGFLGIMGATFCSYPMFIYSMGSLGCGCWMGSCATCILLGINRCCDVNQHLRIRTIFIGRKMYFTIAVPVIYTLYSLLFTKPILFNSNYMSWFFNPMLPGHDATDYVNIAHTVNNCVVSMATTAIYAYLCILLFAKSKHFRSESISKTQTQIFFQSVLICSFNAIAAYIYVYMQFFYSPASVVLVGQLAWQCAHGSVCLIYITMNRTVRRGVIDLIVPRVIRDKTKIGTNRAVVARPILSVVGVDAKMMTTRTGTSSGTVF